MSALVRSGDKPLYTSYMRHSDARCTNQNSFVVLCSSNLFRIFTVIRQSVIIDGLAPDPDQASIFVNSDLYQVIENISKNETIIYNGSVFFPANMHLVGDEDSILVWVEMKLQKQCNRQLKLTLDMLPVKYALWVDYIGSPWKLHVHETKSLSRRCSVSGLVDHSDEVGASPVVSLNSLMAMKWCTMLEATSKRCPIVFQGHRSNFKVTRDRKLPILTRIERFRTVTSVLIHRWIWNDAQSLM